MVIWKRRSQVSFDHAETKVFQCLGLNTSFSLAMFLKCSGIYWVGQIVFCAARRAYLRFAGMRPPAELLHAALGLGNNDTSKICLILRGALQGAVVTRKPHAFNVAWGDEDAAHPSGGVCHSSGMIG
jgi:hypothetical protein